MELFFIRHGHGEHLNDYPNRLNTLHSGLTEKGKLQIKQLRDELKINPDALLLVSPTRRTIETAIMMQDRMDFIISPLVGPRMFPQNPDFPFLACDRIFSKTEITERYGDIEMLDFNLDCWNEGINRIEQAVFEGYARQLFDWVGESYKTIFIISHDGTIINYRIWLGEKGLTRKDFPGEAGVYRMTL